MLSLHSRSKFIEKTLTDSAGREFQVVFLVSLVDGKVVARPVSAKLISPEVLALAGKSFGSTVGAYLGGAKREVVVETPYFAAFTPVVSPYVTLEAILTSQPTRAPSI